MRRDLITRVGVAVAAGAVGEVDDRTLYRGEKETGNLAFHVPPGKHIVKIYFGDSFDAGGYWRH
jgi:hypothetical protein